MHRTQHESYLELVEVGVLLVPRLLEPDEVRGALVELHQQHLRNGGAGEPQRPRFPGQALRIH